MYEEVESPRGGQVFGLGLNAGALEGAEPPCLPQKGLSTWKVLTTALDFTGLCPHLHPFSNARDAHMILWENVSLLKFMNKDNFLNQM